MVRYACRLPQEGLTRKRKHRLRQRGDTRRNHRASGLRAQDPGHRARLQELCSVDIPAANRQVPHPPRAWRRISETSRLKPPVPRQHPPYRGVAPRHGAFARGTRIAFGSRRHQQHRHRRKCAEEPRTHEHRRSRSLH